MLVKPFEWQQINGKMWQCHKCGGLLCYAIKLTMFGRFAPLIGSDKIAQGCETFEQAAEQCELDFERRVSRDLTDNARIVAIQRTGRTNSFTFERNGTFTVIETYGTLSDDLDGWKKELGI